MDSNKADKRYLVFGFDDYYPNGGLGDTRDSFDDLDIAIEFTINNIDSDYRYIYDRIEGMLVWDYDEWCRQQEANDSTGGLSNP